MDNDDNKARKDSLKATLKDLKEKLALRRKMSRASIVVGLLLIAVSPILYFGTGYSTAAGIILVYGVSVLMFAFAKPVSELEIQINDIENELDLLGVQVTHYEKRAEKLFKSHQIQLKKYYDQTLRHSGWIFIVGIFCILLGFGVITWALYVIQPGDGTPKLSEKIVIGSLGAVSGILANFIAVIYLKMYSETIKSLTEFHNRLVVTHHLHFANFLTSKIKEKKLKEKTLSEIANALSKSKTN